MDEMDDVRNMFQRLVNSASKHILEEQKGFQRRFNERDIKQNDPIVMTIVNDDFAAFKSLVTSKHHNAAILLHFIMRLQRTEMFNFLISMKNFDPNSPDNVRRTVLMSLATVPSNEYFGLSLIKKGANVHWLDRYRCSYLHLAARSKINNLGIAKAVLEKGANVNAQTYHGLTPLYVACETKNYNFACLLLCYGADANIPFKGILPIAVTCRWDSLEVQDLFHELLFDFTFDGDKIEVSLTTLVEAMISKTSLFERIVQNVLKVRYDQDDLEHFCNNLRYLQPNNLRLFISKFGNIVEDLISDGRLLITVVELGWICETLDFKNILDVFIESEYVSEMVLKSDPFHSLVACIVEVFNQQQSFVEQEEVTKIICILLSYGLNVSSYDLDTVYKHYGLCELFRILLHMDVNIIRSDKISVSLLYYDLNASIEDVLDDPAACHLLDYYNHTKLREICLRSGNQDLVAKANQMPCVPLLAELSRNEARKHIVESFQIENCKQFYTVLKSLPIGKINKEIIALERKLY